jgi:trehalose 6-phosphate synthase
VNRTGFFLHIPFPAPDLFERLPWCRELIGALLAFDQIGFQTRRDFRNFLDCVRILRPAESRVHGDLVLSRSDPARPTRVGVHPISIEQSLYWEGARTSTIAESASALRAEIGSERIFLGVDRLDYTKGIPEKLSGFERALERYPDLRGRATLVQLIIPSRERIGDYHRLKNRIDRLVGRINGRFTRRGWAPVLYQFGSWPMPELLAFYRAADAALVTPLRDGMNLVSKEYVASSVERGGVGAVRVRRLCRRAQGRRADRESPRPRSHGRSHPSLGHAASRRADRAPRAHAGTRARARRASLGERIPGTGVRRLHQRG